MITMVTASSRRPSLALPWLPPENMSILGKYSDHALINQLAAVNANWRHPCVCTKAAIGPFGSRKTLLSLAPIGSLSATVQ